MNNAVMIIGGGHQGLTMAAHLSLNHIDCYLWNRTKDHISSIIETKKIFCTGIINGTAKIKHVSNTIPGCLQKLIMVTTPSSAHKDIARMLAPYIDNSFVIVLNPGRTFGAAEFYNVLKKHGCCSLPLIAETQTIAYTCRRTDKNTVSIYAIKNQIPIAAIHPKDTCKVLNMLPDCLKGCFIPAKSYMETSLGNVGMVLHCAPVLMNAGWIENKHVDFKYYYEGISESVARFLEKIDKERIHVAKAMGYSIEPLLKWLKRTYGTYGKNLYECLQNNIYYKDIDAPLSLHHRYIEEDVPNGLVPVESMGKIYNVPTPAITTVINLANAVMESDYRATGRTYENVFDLSLNMPDVRI